GALNTDIHWTLLCACALTDKSGTPPKTLASIAEQKLTGKLANRSVWQHTLALAYYRSGQLELTESICTQEIEKLAQSEPNWPPFNAPLLALVRIRQGKLQEARQLLDQVKTWRTQLEKGKEQGFPFLISDPLDIALQCLVLTDEAEQLLRPAGKK
ncbi:MAG: hypothetical protein JNM56_22945, partial [Planctomycetia bacterium]|nr:hypothetical protein [Planctomycetia bacterium]